MEGSVFEAILMDFSERGSIERTARVAKAKAGRDRQSRRTFWLEHLGKPLLVDYAPPTMRLVWLFLFTSVLTPALLSAQANKPQVKVTAVFDGPSPVFDQFTEELSREIRTQLSDRFDVVLVPSSFEGDWTAEGVERQLDEAYSNSEISVVFGFGYLAVRAVAARKDLPKPTILPLVIEAQKQGLPRRGDVSGKRNLSYISEELDISDEADWLTKVAGSKSIVLLTEDSQRDMVSTVTGASQVRLVSAAPTVEALLAAIPSSADGVIIPVMRQLSMADRERLLDQITKRRLPNIAVGPGWLDQGAMMSIRSPNNSSRRAQRAALNLELILEGRPAAQIHVDFEERQGLLVNMQAARAVGVRPSYETLLEADMVNEEEAAEANRIRMNVAMKEAVDQNLDLLVSEKFVEAGEEGVKVRRGPLLPQAGLQVGVVYQDPDRILVGGQVAEWQATTFARASQSLYSERAWTRFISRRFAQEGREYGYFTDVLDIMLSSGVAYVGVLRAEAQERIQRKNIQLTREYLELARLRLEVGVANASELYRWQVTLAENQSSVVNARAVVGQSKIELNRVLNRPSERPIAPIDLPVDDAGRTESPDDPISKYMNDPWSFERLRDFMVREGLRNSPEARQVEARRAAQQRIQDGRGRELWLPEFTVEGGIQHDFWREGEGATVPQPNALDIPQPDKFGWDVGLFLAIPLSRGGSGVADMRRSAILVERLTAEFDRVAQNIDTGVRTELYNAAAAMASVGLTRKAAVAAANNLILVTDLYRRGKVDIITLVDAQTRSLVADLAAADAVYDYVIALLFVNREAGHFRNLDTPEAQQDFSRRLNEFVLAAESANLTTPPAP
ncbi:MAG: TolC family protein [Deltaproteobacteria bacterium]|nr:TolC family protein [Deltaproteobacteria bacterium]